ncbi:DUF7511 domain-containing protein [Halorarius litoreus]|uniref:DUF7511 domain-containing protein n=1 Tax=Halorarius litoreus TaxID=2962676 RepID=UPI0020CF286C|nr:hypothetical protein [Halorarius litoreus]
MDSARTDLDGAMEGPRHGELFLATVTERPDGVEVCTISGVPTSDRLLLAEWIGASGDSFVSLETMR